MLPMIPETTPGTVFWPVAGPPGKIYGVIVKPPQNAPYEAWRGSEGEPYALVAQCPGNLPSAEAAAELAPALFPVRRGGRP